MSGVAFFPQVDGFVDGAGECAELEDAFDDAGFAGFVDEFAAGDLCAEARTWCVLAGDFDDFVGFVGEGELDDDGFGVSWRVYFFEWFFKGELGGGEGAEGAAEDGGEDVAQGHGCGGWLEKNGRGARGEFFKKMEGEWGKNGGRPEEK